jgi:hypothetical protein
MRIFIPIILLAFALAGCSWSRNQTQDEPAAAVSVPSRSQANNLLAGVFSQYRDYWRGKFSRIVAQDFRPDRLEFISSVESAFYSGRILELNYLIDDVLPQDGLLAVTFKWEKKTVPNNSAPQLVLTKGQAEFIFKNVKGRWLLYQVKGNSPF